MTWESELFRVLRLITESAGFAIDTSVDSEVIIPVISPANTRESIRVNMATLSRHHHADVVTRSYESALADLAQGAITCGHCRTRNSQSGMRGKAICDVCGLSLFPVGGTAA